MPDKTFTTTEISRICDVYPATVINWIDSGKLRAYVTPGGHRRVTRTDLVAFLTKFNIPVPDELRTDRKFILIVEDDNEMAKVIERAFGKYKNIFETKIVVDGFEALLDIGKRIPHAVILDILMPRMNGLELCDRLRTMPQTNSMKIIAVTGRKVPSDKDAGDHGIHAIFRKPLVLADVVKTTSRLLNISLESEF